MFAAMTFASVEPAPGGGIIAMPAVIIAMLTAPPTTAPIINARIFLIIVIVWILQYSELAAPESSRMVRCAWEMYHGHFQKSKNEMAQRVAVTKLAMPH